MAGKEDKEEMIGCGILVICFAIAFAIVVITIKLFNVKGFDI